MSSEIKANKISPSTGTAFTLGDSGDTFTVPSGVTLTNSGTASGFGDEAQYFFARMTTSNQNVNDNTATKVNINSEVLDNKSIFDTTNNKLVITADTAGIWEIGGQVAGHQITTSYLLRVFALLYKNGSSPRSRRSTTRTTSRPPAILIARGPSRRSTTRAAT